MCWKSLMLRVASFRPWTNAIDAICASNMLIGQPDFLLSATTLPKKIAAFSSKGRQRTWKYAYNFRALAAKRSRRRPLGINAMPSSISPRVMAHILKSPERTPSNHDFTVTEGDGFINSDSTLVSSRIILQHQRYPAKACDQKGLVPEFQYRQGPQTACEYGFPIHIHCHQSIKHFSGFFGPPLPWSTHAAPLPGASGLSRRHRDFEW